jgi:hypothetical protein
MFDMDSSIEGDEFVKYIYRLASQMSPGEPLNPDALAKAARIMFQLMYTVFPAITLFQPLDYPVNSTGMYMDEEKRLFVVGLVCYIILRILNYTAILNVYCFSTRGMSRLKEEPYGLLSAAGILYKSDVNTVMMKEILRKDECS